MSKYKLSNSRPLGFSEVKSTYTTQTKTKMLNLASFFAMFTTALPMLQLLILIIIIIKLFKLTFKFKLLNFHEQRVLFLNKKTDYRV
jgi:hypothetical protein